MVACVLIAITLRWGLAMHREELRTGAEPESYNRFLAFIIGGGGLIWGLSYLHPFFATLQAILVGAVIALSGIHYAPQIVRSLSAGLCRKSGPGSQD